MKRKRPQATTPKPNKTQTVRLDQPKEVRAIARERIGPVKPGQTILPKGAGKKPKHKKPLDLEDGNSGSPLQ